MNADSATHNHVVRIAVVADLHAVDVLPGRSRESESWLNAAESERDVASHPTGSLIKLIDEKELRADYLLCCGDIAHKAHPTAMRYAWMEVNRIKGALRANRVLATAGNHDVDSRYNYNNFDARGMLLDLTPGFPLESDELNNRYWAQGFVFLREPLCRFLVLNSSAYHGQRSLESYPPEYSHGRVAPRTLKAIEREIAKGSSERIVSVLLCHHHPHKHKEVESHDYSVMDDGTKLIDTLAKDDHGSWLVVHGHKHYPRLCYGAGGSGAPIVFGAGSFSAKLPSEAAQRARNQFYVLEMPIAPESKCGLDIAGTFRAWDWIQGMGWQEATSESGLPERGGFGYHVEFEADALQIAVEVANRGKEYIMWSELVAIMPKLSFVIPDDLEKLVRRLDRDHGVSTIWSKGGTVLQLAVKQ